VGNEWRELAESFPAAKDTSVSGGLAERRRASGAAKNMVLSLRRIIMAADENNFAGAAAAYADYRGQFAAAADSVKLAEAWSLFNPAVRQAHLAALRQLAELAK
jgi:hypothetical protein